MKEIGIGLIGFGTVGAGVVEGLQRNGEVLAARVGAMPVLRRIADLDITTDRGVAVDPALLTTDAAAVIAAPDVDVVLELIGGTTVARELVLQAMMAGKSVVTANKALLAYHAEELFRVAGENGVSLCFGASVGGGIPVIRALRDGLAANRIDSIHGILNGTCNYILTRMEGEGMAFEPALDAAQKEGYAEADPSLDIDGHDTAHKAAILASLAYGFCVPIESVHVEGIRGLSSIDIRYAADMGYRIKLLAVIKRVEAGIDVRVHPALVPTSHMLASVHGVYNAIMVHGDMTGNTLYYGRGAGKDPTAATVLADVADVMRCVMADTPAMTPGMQTGGASEHLCPMDEVQTRYYLRLPLLDQPGVLARITAILGQHEISMASVLQKEQSVEGYAPAVIVTHQATEQAMNAALAEIRALDVVGDSIARFRIEA